jgi:hypothetical protein
MQKRTRFLSTAFCTTLSCFNEFLFSWNLHFRILTRPCFTCLGVPLASNPDLLSFCTQYANDFANPANSVLIPVFLFFNKQWRGGGGRWGGGVKCEKVEFMFNQELTPIGPRPNLILFDPLHCYKKFIHAVGDHHWPRKIYGWSAQGIWITARPLSVICSFDFP